MEKPLTQQEKFDLEMRNIIEEARVILPGVQALFGFQTMILVVQPGVRPNAEAHLCEPTYR